MLKFGLEFEGTETKQLLAHNFPRFSVGTDGSIRTEGTKAYEDLPDNWRCQYSNQGVEYISDVFSMDEMFTTPILNVLNYMDCCGEQCRANNSIHIHTSDGESFNVGHLVEFYKFARDIVDRDLFNISVPQNSTQHRGMFNEFIYCRPLVSPPWTLQYGSSNYYKPAIGEISEVQSSHDFLYAMGRLDLDHNKWIPPRYTSINFVNSLIGFHTVEYRVFNFTTDINTVIAWTLYCSGVTSLIKRNTYDKYSIEYCVKKSAEVAKLDADFYIDILRKSYTNVYDSINMGKVLSHTGRYIDWLGGETGAETYDLLSPQEYCREDDLIKVRNVHPTDCLEKNPTNLEVLYV